MDYFKNHFALYLFIIFVIQSISFSTLRADAPDYPPERLQQIHSKIKLVHGHLHEEYDEQLMIAMYLPEDAKVLEIGANFGRTTCVIASILNNSDNFVTVETNQDYIRLLKDNQSYNNLHFHIETRAISKVPLVQSVWRSIPSEVDIPGYTRLQTITFEELQEEYGIEFDTLVVDCEGAFYYILRDDPDILENIKMVIIENDFETAEQMDYVLDLLEQYGLRLVYNKAGAYPHLPGYSCFFQVWKR